MARIFWALALAAAWFGSSHICEGQTFQDLFADRQTLTAVSGALTGSNTNATVESGEPNHGGKIGGHSLWISWLAPANGVVRFKTESSGFDTLLSAYYFGLTNGTTFAQLVEAARNDDSDELGDRESKIEFGVIAGRHYEIAVDGYFGAVGEVKLQWSLDATQIPPPTVISTPADATLQIGDPVTLTVLLTNVPGGTKFKWYFNGSELLDEKNTTLVIPSMQVTNVGRYKLLIDAGQHITFFTIPTDLQINTEGAKALAQSKFPDAPGTGLYGSDGSAGPALRIARCTATGRAPKGAGAFGVVRGYDGSQIFDTTYATTDPAEPAHCGIPPGASYWLTYQPPANGTITLDTIGSSYETVLEIYTYDSPPKSYRDLISVACNHGSPAGYSSVQPVVTKSRQYVIAVNGVGGAHGIARLNYRLNTNQTPQAPVLVILPKPLVVTNGSNVTLAPSVTASPPLSFVWRKDGQVLANSNSPSLQLFHVGPTNSGNYLVAITNDFGGLEVTLPLRVLMPTQCELTDSKGSATLSFLTFIGQRYTIEQSVSISGPWQPCSAPWIGDGLTVVTNFPALGTLFYRLKLE